MEKIFKLKCSLLPTWITVLPYNCGILCYIIPLGVSRGRSLSEAISTAKPDLMRDLQVSHLCAPSQMIIKRKRVQHITYISKFFHKYMLLGFCKSLLLVTVDNTTHIFKAFYEGDFFHVPLNKNYL